MAGRGGGGGDQPHPNHNQHHLPIKEGFVKKRSGRLHRWTLRFFSLSGPKLSYRLKDSPVSASTNPMRGEYDLVPGCLATEVSEDSNYSLSMGKKMFSFWIVWPEDKKTRKGESDKDKAGGGGLASAEDADIWSDASNEVTLPGHALPPTASFSSPLSISTSTAATTTANSITAPAVAGHKDLKEIVRSEVESRHQLKIKAKEQVDNHKAHDSNVSLGAKVAAVAVGGAVIGALTAGVGLIPYLTIVGIATVAGGGAVVLQYRKPKDSRLIMACESIEEALSWRNAIVQEIFKLDKSGRPIIPAIVDTDQIASLLGASSEAGLWRCTSVHEGMRIMQRKELDEDAILGEGGIGVGVGIFGGKSNSSSPSSSSRISLCRKGQLVIQSTPIAAFISLMEDHHWPKGGSFIIDRAIDDHADFIAALALKTSSSVSSSPPTTPMSMSSKKIKLSLSRFWKLDDEGTYMITLNSVAETPHSAAAAAAVVVSRSTSLDSIHNNNGSNISISSNSSSSGVVGSNGQYPDVNVDSSSSSSSTSLVMSAIDSNCDMSAVISISPRKDHGEYDDDVSICLVSVVVQMSFPAASTSKSKSSKGKSSSSTCLWTAEEASLFIDNFITQHTVEVQQYMEDRKYLVLPPISSSSSSSLSLSSVSAQPLPSDSRGGLKSDTSGSSVANRNSSLISSSNSGSSGSSSRSHSSHLRATTNNARFVTVEAKRKEGSSGGGGGGGRVTTVQPGLEDVTQDSYNLKAATTNQVDVELSAHNPNKKKTFFSFSRSNSSNNSNNNSLTSSNSISDQNSSQDSSSKQGLSNSQPLKVTRSGSGPGLGVGVGLGSKSKFSFRRRSMNANPDLVRIRGQIAAKEYEIQRMESIMKESSKGASNSSSSSSSGIGSSGGVARGGGINQKDKVDLQTFQNSIQELLKLKEQYLKITGSEYDHSNSNINYNSNSSSSDVSRSFETKHGDDSKMPFGDYLGISSTRRLLSDAASAGVKSGGLPSHWMFGLGKQQQQQQLTGRNNKAGRGGEEEWTRYFSGPLVKAALIVLLCASLMLSLGSEIRI